MVIKEIANRRSVREYNNEPVSEKDILEIIKAGQFAPSARNNRAVEFIVIKDFATKEKLYKISGKQEFVKKSDTIIIPVTNNEKTSCPIQDLSVASENMLIQASALGIGAVWKGLKEEDAERYIKELLNIPEKFTLTNIIPIGYPKKKSEPYSDDDFDKNKIHYEKW